jgi:hypothetical protein
VIWRSYAGTYVARRRDHMKASLVTSLLLLACADQAAPPIDPQPACGGPTISRSQFVDASVAYLRDAFGVTDGFTGGTTAYGEGWVSLNDGGCPLADWTTLAYVAPIDPQRVPIELRADHDRVAALWALNGRRFIAYLPRVEGDAAPWWQATMPDNANAIANIDADPAQVDQLVARISAEQPAVTVTWLDAIGILTLEVPIGTFAFDSANGKVAAIEGATAMVRDSGLFDIIEWSGFVVRVPFENWPASAVETDVLEPECLRTETRELRDDGAFSTLPALAAPLGAGPTENPDACQS